MRLEALLISTACLWSICHGDLATEVLKRIYQTGILFITPLVDLSLGISICFLFVGFSFLEEVIVAVRDEFYFKIGSGSQRLFCGYPILCVRLVHLCD